jgi:hypothetical protein
MLLSVLTERERSTENRKIFPAGKSEKFIQFLSSREYSTGSDYYVIPLAGKNPSAFFFTDTPLSDESIRNCSSLFETLMDLTAEKLKTAVQTGKADPEALSSMLNPSDKQALEELSSLIELSDEKEKRILFVLLSMKNIFSEMESELKTDIFRIKTELALILKSMFETSGKAIFFNDRVLIAVSGRFSLDAQLLVHQLELALKNIFPKIKNLSKNILKISSYPDNGSSAEEIFENLMQHG